MKKCPVCGENLEYRLYREGLIDMIVPRNCLCKRKEHEREEEQRKAREQMQRINRYREKGLADAQYKSCTFAVDDRVDKHASDFSRGYVENWGKAQEENAGILFWGNVGGGKTFYAAAIANALIDRKVPVVMTTIPRLVSQMQKEYGRDREEVLRLVRESPLLILDDVGTERNTEYGNEAMYEIINERYKAKKPLIVTTNLTVGDMQSSEDVSRRRVYDRIFEMCVPCRVAGQNRRQNLGRQKLRAMEEQMKKCAAGASHGLGEKQQSACIR